MNEKADIQRRDLMKLMGLGGIALASSLFPGVFGCSSGAKARGPTEDFFFLQISDTHWGFSGAPNPQSAVMLPNTVAAINAASPKPDFVIFTGDLIHDDAMTTSDLRLMRMSQFHATVSMIDGPELKFIAGEHDAAADAGAAFQKTFGDLHWSFDHKGVHFVGLDNVSAPTSSLGSDQIAWLEADLAPLDPGAPIVVFAHRPLFSLFPQWDWFTSDGQDAIDVLSAYDNVAVFYGHIHQEIETMTGHIPHRSARSLMFPFPPAGSQPMKTPVAWNPAKPGDGLGYRTVDAGLTAGEYTVKDFPPALAGG